MSPDIEKLANESGFYIINSPMWQQQGLRFLLQFLVQRCGMTIEQAQKALS